MKIHLPSIGIGIGIMLGISIIAFIVIGPDLIKSPSMAPSKEIPTTSTDNQQTALNLLTDNTSPILGSKDASITMIEFGDYQCFYCNKFYHTVEPDIVKNYIDTGKVRMVFKDFTIIGQDSVNAAHAAHCAQEQGKFWDYHDTLYNNWTGENNGWASSNHLLEFANKTGLNTTQFSQCMEQSKYISIIKGSNSNAKDLGLTGTPDFFIIAPDHSVSKIEGAQPYEVFDELFKSKLK